MTDENPYAPPQAGGSMPRPDSGDYADDLRARLALDLWRLVHGEMTNDDFDDLYYEVYVGAEDHAVEQIACFGWSLYSSDVLVAYRLTGRHALGPDEWEVYERCELFLRTDQPYEWPPEPADSAQGCLWALAFNLGLPGSIAMLFIAALPWMNGDLGFACLLGAPSLLVLVASVGVLCGVGMGDSEELRQWKQSGDFEVWPFIRQEDHAAALQGRPNR